MPPNLAREVDERRQFCVATGRGRGKSTTISPTIRPGRGDMTSTRSARNTASEML